MSAALRAVLQAFNPPSVTGKDWKGRSHLYLLRLGAVLCIILIPAFAVLYHANEPLSREAVILHTVMEGFALLMLVVTFIKEWFRKHAARLLLSFGFIISLWAAALSYLSGFGPDAAIGFFLVTVSCAMFLSLAFDSIEPLSVFGSYTLVLTLFLIGMSNEPGVNEAIYIASILVSLALVYVAVSARIQVQNALQQREEHLMEAQSTASLGNWELNLRTGSFHWSQEMFRIVGLDPEKDRASFDDLISRLSQNDRGKLTEFWTALKANRPHEDILIRMQVDDANSPDRTLRIRGAFAKRTSHSSERLYGICQDVTEDAERERQLLEAKNVADHAREEAERAREQAEEVARMKSEFLTNMSHEIRTPLTAIIGFAQVLGEEVEPERRGLVEPIEQSGRRLLTTLNSVLDLAQLRANGLNMHIEPVDVAEEAHEFADMLRQLASEKGLALVVTGPVQGLYAEADRAVLNRVLTNLVSNAIKFTDEGRVTISLDKEDAYVRIRVHDTGRGIHPDFLPKLFEEFRQESTGTTRTHEGSGLGLAITKGLVQQMGGTICVDSTINVGSVFTVLLPQYSASRIPDTATVKEVNVS